MFRGNLHLPVCGSKALHAPFGTAPRGLKSLNSAYFDEHAHEVLCASSDVGWLQPVLKAIDPPLQGILLVFFCSQFWQTIKIAALTSHCLEDGQAVHVPTSRGLEDSPVVSALHGT